MKVTVVFGSATFVMPEGAEVHPSGVSLLSASVVEVPDNDESTDLPMLEIEWFSIFGKLKIVTSLAEDGPEDDEQIQPSQLEDIGDQIPGSERGVQQPVTAAPLPMSAYVSLVPEPAPAPAPEPEPAPAPEPAVGFEAGAESEAVLGSEPEAEAAPLSEPEAAVGPEPEAESEPESEHAIGTPKFDRRADDSFEFDFVPAAEIDGGGFEPVVDSAEVVGVGFEDL